MAPEKEKEGEEKKVEKKEEEKQEVTLSAEQYSALLDKVTELEEISQRSKKEVFDLDDLAEEGRRKKVEKPPAKEVDLEGMTNAQLVEHVFEEVNKAGAALDVKIETLKLLREIDKCEAKYDDFWKYEKEIRKTASENPTLSLEKAYKLAKLDEPKKGEKKEEEEGEPKDKRTILHTLPPKLTSKGEKPGVASSATKGSEIKTLKEATQRAWDEVVGKGKESI